MENILIIYKSKYGAAREYAQLLGKALNTAPVSIDQARSQMVASADTIILCGGIYASSKENRRRFLQWELHPTTRRSWKI